MLIGFVCSYSTATGFRQEAGLHQIWLIKVAYGVNRFGNNSGQGFQTNRSPCVLDNDGFQETAIGGIQTFVVNFIKLKRFLSDVQI